MTRVFSLLALGFCAAACSSSHASAPSAPPPTPATLPPSGPRDSVPDFGSGSRLRAEYWGIEGLRVFRGFVDTATNEECNLSSIGGADGLQYCLPPRMLNAGGGWFADAGCMQPLAYSSDDTCPPPPYALAGATDTCTERGAVFRTGASVAPATAFLRRGSGPGSCVPASQSPYPPPAALYALGEAVPLDHFARGHEEHVMLGARLGELRVVTDDGAYLAIDGWDGVVGEPVEPVASPPPAIAWSPSRVAYAGGHLGSGGDLFADAACTRSVAQKIAYDALCPLTAVVDYAHSQDSLHQIGPRATKVFAPDATGACVPVSPDDGQDYFEIGAPIPASALEPGQVVEIGLGRLRAQFAAGTDGAPIIPYVQEKSVYRDPVHDTPCALYTLPDGHVRCLPLGSSTWAFGDPQCQTTVLLWYPPEGPVPSMITRIVPTQGGVPPGGSACGGAGTTPEVSLVGKKLPTSTYYNPDGMGGCQASPNNTVNPYALYLLGATVLLGEFAEGVARTE